MRSIILQCALGLIGVGVLAGCNSLSTNRGQHCVMTPDGLACHNVVKQCKPAPAPAPAPAEQRVAVAKKDYRGPVESIPIRTERMSDIPRKLPNVPVVSAPVVTNELPPIKATETKLAKAEPVKSADEAKGRTDPEPIPTPNPEPGTKSDSRSENFDLLTGTIQEWRKTVRLRYASIEQVDIYGGYVVLEGPSVMMDALKDGQHARVRGTLIPPSDRTSPARYRVDSIEIVE